MIRMKFSSKNIAREETKMSLKLLRNSIKNCCIYNAAIIIKNWITY